MIFVTILVVQQNKLITILALRITDSTTSVCTMYVLRALDTSIFPKIMLQSFPGAVFLILHACSSFRPVKSKINPLY